MKILIVGPFPNPINGCAIANEALYNGLVSLKYTCFKINTSTERKISSKQGSSFSASKALRFLLKYFSAHKIIAADIIYLTPGQTFYGILKYAPFIFLASIFGKKIVLHLHGNYLGTEYRSLKGIKRIIFKYLISKIDIGVVLSRSLEDNFEGLISKRKVKIVENFVTSDLFEYDENEKSYDSLKIVYLSNLMPEKGIHDFLESLSMLKEKNIKFKAKIAGNLEGDIYSMIEKINSKEGSYIEYLGVVKGKEKKELLLWSNVFILPTYYKMEGQPISILESMATANLVLSTRHAGIPDIMSESNGFFVDKKSPKSIFLALRHIINNPDTFRKAVSNKKYALERFTEEKFINNILQIFNGISKS